MVLGISLIQVVDWLVCHCHPAVNHVPPLSDSKQLRILIFMTVFSCVFLSCSFMWMSVSLTVWLVCTAGNFSDSRSCYHNSSLSLSSTASLVPPNSRGKTLSKHVGLLLCHDFLNTSKYIVAVWTSDGRVEGMVACSALIPHGNTRLMWIQPISPVWLPASVRSLAWGDLRQQKKRLSVSSHDSTVPLCSLIKAQHNCEIQ